MKFDRYGNLIVSMSVPFEFKDLAIPLTNAFGLPLHIDVQIWKPFADRTANSQAVNRD